ncbi:MAG: aminoacyl-tRNA hydrolase [Proteobacteria bacterium]|nr:aminoacyl-tRNA hydrolase [Pseudomonadota bacterium]
MRFVIPEAELRWRFDTSGGPGGQHANRSNTRVELLFDISSSHAFDQPTKDRLLGRLGSEIRVIESSSRSQTENRKRAKDRLDAILTEADTYVRVRRRRTGPTRSAKRRRLEAKRVRGRTKRLRGRPDSDE